MKFQTWFVFVLVVFCAACGGSTQTDDGQLCSFPPQADAGNTPEAEAGVDALHEPEARVPTLTVKLNPKAQGSVVNINDKYIQPLWLDLEGDELEDMTTSSLSLTRSGMGQDSSIQLALFDKDYNLLWPLDGNPIKVDPQTHKAVFQGMKIKVPAKGKVPIVAIALFSGKPEEIHAMSLAQASDIVTDKGVVEGTFPIQGPTFSLVDGPNYFTQLIYENPNGPLSGTLTGGEQNGRLLEFEARSIFYEFWFYGWSFDLVALDGGKVRGSKGTFLIKQARITDGSSTYLSDGMFMNPAFTDPGAEDMSFRFYPDQLVYPIVLGKGINKIFEVRVDLAATEDEPGEFFGHKYRLDLHMPVFGNDLNIQTFADFLNPGAVEPKTSLQGPSVTILAP